MGLAIDSYEHLRALNDDDGLLNLAWTLDERDCLAIDLPALVRRELEQEARGGLPYANRYLVDDPYGETLLAPAVGVYLGADVPSGALTAGAGVLSLLHALAPLATGSAGPLYVAGDAYPDLPHWVVQAGARCAGGPPDLDAARHAEAARAAGAALVLVERPSLTGDRFADSEELRALCEALPAETVVLADESNANYCAPSFSAARLAGELPNLVVVRGLSKGYGLGGLRLGYALAAAPLRARVRALVPPLQAGSLSLRIGAAVLRLGDVAAPLRARVAESKAELRTLLRDAGFPEAAPASAPLPYVLLDSGDGPRVERRGLLGKEHIRWSAAGPERLYRLSAPLAPARRERLRVLLAP